MAFGVVHQFPGGTKENYEASIAAVHPANGLPDGQIFRDDVLLPRMQAGIPNGFPTPPEETEFDVSALLP
jgi:hypothetical protein